MVLLIGCDHFKAQTYPAESELDDPQNEIQRAFRTRIVQAIEQYSPTLIAEEQHPDILQKRKLRSVPLEIALKKQIPHKFCEPSFEDKKRLGIKRLPALSADYETICRYFDEEWPLREEFWIGQIQANLQERVLFICGACHRETLRKRLESRGVKVKIIDKGFVASSMPKMDFLAYKATRRKAHKDTRSRVPVGRI